MTGKLWSHGSNPGTSLCKLVLLECHHTYLLEDYGIGGLNVLTGQCDSKVEKSCYLPTWGSLLLCNQEAEGFVVAI